MFSKKNDVLKFLYIDNNGGGKASNSNAILKTFQHLHSS